MKRMPRESTTRYAILGLLSLTPCSGYDIKKMADMSISHFWSENYGNIYPVLRVLEAEGLVERESGQTPGRPPKSVYCITEQGSRELYDWLMRPAETHPFRNELLLKIFFSGDVPFPVIKESLKRESEKQAANLETYHGIEEMLKNNEPYKSQKALPLWLATVDYGKRAAVAAVEWCEATIQSLG